MDPLALLAAEPARVALFLDVDGVLAPIVERPEDASVPEGTRAELRRLAGRYALVACVTGRPTTAARRIVGVDTLRYVGEHGLELVPEAAAWSERIHGFVASSGWDDVELKGASAALHYRRAPDHDVAHAQLEQIAAAAGQEGFRTRFGRLVLEILPPLDVTKGTAVRLLLDESGVDRGLYAGDDTTDLDGFSALDGLELAVRVAVVSMEAPSALAERADLVVDSTTAFLELLKQL